MYLFHIKVPLKENGKLILSEGVIMQLILEWSILLPPPLLLVRAKKLFDEAISGTNNLGRLDPGGNLVAYTNGGKLVNTGEDTISV